MAAVRQVQGGGKTAYSNTNWEAYANSRPTYPQSLVKLINAHHREQQTPSWNRLVDIGSGNGIAVTLFAENFKTLHISDPGASNVEKATGFVADWLAQNSITSAIESSVSTGEEAYKYVGDADMVIAASAAHFMDPDGLADSCARMLRRGGTMAIFTYWWPTFPRQSQNFIDEFNNSSISFFSHLRRNSDEVLNTSIGNVLMRMWSGREGGLEYLPIPSDKFENKKRVLINSSHGEMFLMKKGINSLLWDGEAPVPSRVQQDDKIIRLETGTDNDADGWGVNVDKQFLVNFLQTMRPAGGPMSDEQFDSYLAGFSRVFDKECPSGKVYSLWPVNLVLATRK